MLTSPLKEAILAWVTAEQIDWAVYRTLMQSWVEQAYDGSGANPIHGLEDGTLAPAEFERLLAAELCTVDGGEVDCTGLLSRMFQAFQPVEEMYDALRAARRAGVPTALLSNSWGNEYPRELFAELFDAVVISGEVGLRKPDERIFRHTVGLLGLEPAECVFIDDIEHNIRAAEALGIVGLHHTDPAVTVARLEDMLGLPLTS
ncbi:HAD family phosphatase [Actinomadura craniellae]|uniref:HAD family phosphatase n=1 Tax=Actinomadura craniellae TaxID=2231787 RepID=A0A365H690_9ACTN|nr:HAD family phosphatase [Actinomadura craniellae]